MNFLPPLISYILGKVYNNGRSSKVTWRRILGILLLIHGLGLGVYFSYKLLIPLAGEITSGLVISGALLLFGGILFYSTPSSPADPSKELLSKLENVVKDLHVPATIEKNIGKIIGAALGTGILLAYLHSHKKD